jgi:hypothetical protein
MNDGIIFLNISQSLPSKHLITYHDHISFGLQVNESKTKCTVISTSEARRNRIGQNLTIGEYNFEVVKGFSYLGSKVNCINNIDGEIYNRILLANRACYGLRNLFTSLSVFRKTKCLLYKTLILPVALYASKTWPLTKNEIALNTFERKI